MKAKEFNKDFLRRFTDNELSEPEYETLMQWLSTLSPEEKQSFLDEHIHSLNMEVSKTPTLNFDLLRNKIEQRNTSRKTLGLWIGRTAAVLIPFAIYFGVIKRENNDHSILRTAGRQQVKMIRVVNSGIYGKTILLEDSSIVILSSGATLSYPEKFAAKKRALSLTGKAFFDVKHETSRSFVVSTDGVQTTVLGTSFWINASAVTRKTTIKVKTGKVGVQHETEPAIFLLPGESAMYNQISGQLSKVTPKKQERTQLKTEQTVTALSFNESSIKNVVNELEKQYHIKIILETGVDPELKINLNTRGKSIVTVMEEIKNQAHINYEININSIHIKTQ